MSNAEIAVSIAKALGLREGVNHWTPLPNENAETIPLLRDGSNLFDPHWQVRCRDWLLERGYVGMEASVYAPNHNEFVGVIGHAKPLVITCPAAEFCARAIHALTKAAP